jgi:hypothetical protein
MVILLIATISSASATSDRDVTSVPTRMRLFEQFELKTMMKNAYNS